MSEKVVAVSGGFDPIHVGHIRMIQAAALLGTKLVVIVNNDSFLMRKKGYVFMPLAERMEIIRAMKDVNVVIEALDDDQTVCETLRFVEPHIFANGGDRRTDYDIPETQVCRELGIAMVFGIGGEKIQSSSELVENSPQ